MTNSEDLPKEHSVRKTQHYTIWIDNKARYLCNQAVDGTITKMVVNPSYVTCKNCLKILKGESKK